MEKAETKKLSPCLSLLRQHLWAPDFGQGTSPVAWLSLNPGNTTSSLASQLRSGSSCLSPGCLPPRMPFHLSSTFRTSFPLLRFLEWVVCCLDSDHLPPSQCEWSPSPEKAKVMEVETVPY